MDQTGRAFVPGHVTAFFSPHPAQDPLLAGSRGVGLALSDGVTVQITDGDVVTLNGEPSEIAAVETVLAALDLTASVRIETPLPVGAGFGVSGAAALGTAFAATAASDRRRLADELVAIAHRADVEAGTGLGDVVAQARGGVPVRLAPGAPPHGRVDAIPARRRVEYVSFGGLSTETVLSGDTEALTAAGERALEAVTTDPSLGQVMETARGFVRETDLYTEQVSAAVRTVRENGGEASMAMLGETVFGLGTALSDAGFDPAVCQIHPGGAALEPTEPVA